MRHNPWIFLFIFAAFVGCSSPSEKTGDGTPACEPGTTFTGEDGCSTCFCGDEGAACSRASCDDITADAGTDGGVDGCDDSGTFRAEGESFTGGDGCSSCFCGDGEIVCTNVGCADNNMCPPCEAPPRNDCVGSGPCGCGPYTCPDAGTDVGSPVECGDTTCGRGELCMQIPGCPNGMDSPPECVPIPDTCDAELSCGCFGEDPCGGGCTTCSEITEGRITCACGCLCASPDTPIATPSGNRPIAELREGDLVYSVDRGAVVAVPLARVGRQRVSGHRVLHVEFDDGSTFEISPGHPTADGRLLADLRPGDTVDGRRVVDVNLVSYHHDFTHDVLPGSSSGAYYADGVLIGSTLAAPRPERAVASTTGARLQLR